MRKLLFFLLGCLLVVPIAYADETYSVTLQTSGVTKLDLGRLQSNSDVCTGLGLVATCTQAQACVAKGVTGGASCTNPDALAAGVRIFGNSLNERGSFILNALVKSKLDDFVSEQARRDKKAASTFCGSATQGQIDALCTDYGLAAGCYICQ
jgi:hypothetical protein